MKKQWKVLEMSEGLNNEVLQRSVTESQNNRMAESQNVRGWKGPLWVI